LFSSPSQSSYSGFADSISSANIGTYERDAPIPITNKPIYIKLGVGLKKIVRTQEGPVRKKPSPYMMNPRTIH